LAHHALLVHVQQSQQQLPHKSELTNANAANMVNK
jgi:hypothetical protein